MPKAWRLPLVPTLVAAAAAELAVHRVLLQFLKPEILQPETEMFRLFNDGIGPVVFFFTTFVALAACTWLLTELVRDDEQFALPWRILVGLIACVFLPVAVVGCLFSTAGLKPPNPKLLALHPYLKLSFALLVVAVCGGLWQRRGPVLPRVGFLLLALPLLLFAYFSYYDVPHRYPTSAAGPSSEDLDRAKWLAHLGREILLYAGLWVFVFYYPLLRWVHVPPGGLSSPSAWVRSVGRRLGTAFFELGPLACALGAGLALGLFIKLDYGSARTAAEAALAYDLPAASDRSLLLVGSFALFTLTVAGLAWRPGGPRMVAAGLVCVLVAGFPMGSAHQLAEPLHYLLAVVGLVAVVRGLRELWDSAQEATLVAASSPIEAAVWQRFLQALSGALRAQDADRNQLSEVTERQVQTSTLSGVWRGTRVALRLERRQDRVVGLDLVLGEELEQRADWSAALAARAGRRGEDESPTPRLEIRDRAQCSARVLTPELTERVQQLIRGRVEVWLNIGLHYQLDATGSDSLMELIPPQGLTEADASNTPLPLGRLLSLLELLHDLARQAGVPAGPAPSSTPSGKPVDTAG